MDYEKLVAWLNNTHAIALYNDLFWVWEVVLPSPGNEPKALVTVDDKCFDWLSAVHLAMMRH